MEKKEPVPRSKALLKWIAALSALALAVGLWMYACRKTARPEAPIPDVSTIVIDPHYCEKHTARCERLCAGCANKAQCFASGGECGGGPPAVGTFQDHKDRGPDIWIPGCHYQYQQAGCVMGNNTLAGDWCEDDGIQIEEWFDRVCHDAKGDHYTDNCDTKCKLLGLGAGKCVTDKAFCPGAMDSAHCECEKGNPLPPSTNPS